MDKKYAVKQLEGITVAIDYDILDEMIEDATCAFPNHLLKGFTFMGWRDEYALNDMDHLFTSISKMDEEDAHTWEVSTEDDIWDGMYSVLAYLRLREFFEADNVVVRVSY